MANHGAGNKFVSINLNKSSSYGARVRLGGQVGGGGGMVVLSRPKSSQKPGQKKLSVPSPVNLPSMRKEHEKFDSSGAAAAAGSSSRPSSAGMGWSKPVMQEKRLSDSVDGGSKLLGSVYMPPARSPIMADSGTINSQLRSYTPVAVLRGDEDFPSLHTSLSTSSGHSLKQNEGANKKSKQFPAQDLSSNLLDTSNIGRVFDMPPQRDTSQHEVQGNGARGSRIEGPRSAEESQKHESYILGFLPEVRVNPRFDWADDERDTGHVFNDRSRTHGSLNNEGYRDRDFEMPKGSYMPPKPAPNDFNKWGQPDRDTCKMLSSDSKAGSYVRDPFPFSSGGIVGVVKRKKDLPKLTELHDPARESFEAELERVQKMQEQERQRQERAMQLVGIEEEKRLNHARELAEMKRRMEAEARETAWRAEQEQRQSMQKAEDQRIAREEEKQRMRMEEERRKQAAEQKLLELEERIARRQAEVTREGVTSDPGKVKETSRAADISDWEDGERMEERITTSASSDSSSLNRIVDFDSRRPSFADNSVLPGREKSINLQRRDVYEYVGSSHFALRNQESSLGRDFPLHAKKSLTRKDVCGGSGFMYPQNYTKAGVLDPKVDDPFQSRNGLQTGYDNVRKENLENHEMVAFRPGHASMRTQLQDGSGSVRCDSQSSLSVTSPPSSPAYLSHEDLEGSRDTPGSSADADDQVDMAYRNGAVDDEELVVQNCKKIRHQQVYDEAGEYHEGYEVHAEEAADIDLNEEFEGLNLDGKDSPHVSENLILGFNEGIEVGMPSDESEGNQNENGKFAMSLSIIHADSLQSDSHISAQSSTEMQKIVGQTSHASVKSNVDPQTSIGLLEAIASSAEPLLTFATHPVSQTVISSMPAAANHPNVPVKLQFGLFCGPSLIPSPVPSIQIGSIQMPLHLHPHVGSSLPHQSGPPFHFGQLRYNTQIAQGILPLAPQALSLAQPTQFANQTQAPAGPMSVQQPSQSQFANNRDTSGEHQESFRKMNLKSTVDGNSLQLQGKESSGGPSSSDNSMETDKRHGLDVKVNNQLQHDSKLGDFMSSTSGDLAQLQIVPPQRFSRERVMVRPKAHSPVSGGRGRGRKNFFSSTSFGTRSSNSAFVAKLHRAGQQGGEQMQINSDRRFPGSNYQMGFGARGARVSSRNGSRRGVFLEKQASQTTETKLPILGAVSTKDVTIGSKFDEGIGSNSSIAGHNASQAGEGCHKRSIEEDIDVTLESGVVRVYEQPGIDVPSEEDDFIEVRSKRQMLNDRREQRENDYKAKFRVSKNLQKPRHASQTRAQRNSSKISFSPGVDSISASKPLAPIGTPSTHNDSSFEERSHSFKPVHASNLPVVSTGEKVKPGSINENKSKSMEKVEESMGLSNNLWVSQQVLPLTQSQLEDAMTPVRLDANGSYSGISSESICVPVSSSSSLINNKSFSSSASPVNSLLAGKKIQFGAVTSPSVLPPCSLVITQGIGTGRLDQVSHELSASVHSLNVPKKSCTHVEMSESEVKAATSALAVVTSDIPGTGAGRSVNVSDSEGLKHVTDDGNKNDQKSSDQSRNEESLSVSLPADLSIDMSPISVWQPLHSPQSAPHHMLSHFPVGHPSHFPLYEMNPMVGGPVFTVGTSGSQTETQSHNNNTTMPGPPGPWQQHSSGADSFYGHPAWFSPFISPPGGVTGPQGPPHMVLYNQLAPVGQFGQVGLSFMGTTCLPSGKHPDWKHTPTSSAMAVGEENVNCMGTYAGQHISHNIPASVQLLASGHLSHSVAPPLPMFDVTPYQQSSEMSGPAIWSHVPPQHPNSMPQLLPLQPRPERSMHAQPSPADSQSASVNNLPLTSSAPGSKFSALDLGESSGSATMDPLVSRNSDATVDAGKIGSCQSGGSSQNISSMKLFQHHKSGYNNLRGGGSSQRNSSGGEWPNRRIGYHSRNQSSETGKSYHSAKVKRIYVPKQPAANTTTAPGTE